jgi:hypothetical protein
VSTQPVKASDVDVEDSANVGTTDETRLEFLAELETGRYHRVPIEMVKLAKKNPRRGAVAEGIESLREFGQHRAAVVQQKTGEVIVGNHMLKAMHALGWTELDIFLVSDDDQTALRRALADNATGDKATWDQEELAQVLSMTGPVPGIDQPAVDKLLASVKPPEDPSEATFPLVPRLNEKYDYVLVFCENETDWAWLETRFGVERAKSYKSGAVAKCHVITVAQAQERLGG